MKVSRDRIGATDVLIAVVDVDGEPPQQAQQEGVRLTQQTANAARTGALDQAHQIIRDLASRLGDTMGSLGKEAPSECTVQFALALSASTGKWIFSAGATVNLQVTFKWQATNTRTNG